MENKYITDENIKNRETGSCFKLSRNRDNKLKAMLGDINDKMGRNRENYEQR